ncbi:hypothetical protein [Bacillus sp. Brlt_9]|uniref:hypothetical protein n=1 Tax=Bacillus sp. Brlt_9 TaxID=3110916 RepID=UPI003F7B4E47
MLFRKEINKLRLMSLAIIFALLIPLITALDPSKVSAASMDEIDNDELVFRTGLTVGDSSTKGITLLARGKKSALGNFLLVSLPYDSRLQNSGKAMFKMNNGDDDFSDLLDWLMPSNFWEGFDLTTEGVAEGLEHYKGGKYKGYGKAIGAAKSAKDVRDLGINLASGWAEDFDDLEYSKSLKVVNVILEAMNHQEKEIRPMKEKGIKGWLNGRWYQMNEKNETLYVTDAHITYPQLNSMYINKKAAKLPKYDGVKNPSITKENLQLLVFDVYRVLNHKTPQTKFSDYAKKLVADYNNGFKKVIKADGEVSRPTQTASVCTQFGQAYYYFDEDNYFNAVHFGDQAASSCKEDGLPMFMQMASARLLEIADWTASQGDKNNAFKYYEKLIKTKSVPGEIKQQARNRLKDYYDTQAYYNLEDYYNAVYYAGKSINAGYGSQVASLLNNASTKLSMEADADANAKRFNDAVVKYRILKNTYGVPQNIKDAATKNESSVMKEFNDAKYYYANGSYYNAVHFGSIAVAKGLWLEEVTTFLKDASGKLSAQADQKANNKQYYEAINDYKKIIGAYGVPENIKQAAQKNMDSIYKEFTLADGYFKNSDYYNAVYYSTQALAKGLSEQKVVDLVNNSSTQLSMLADKKATNKEYNQAANSYGLLMNAYGVPANIKTAATTNYNKIYTEYTQGNNEYKAGNYFNAVHYASLSYAKGVTTAEVKILLNNAAGKLSALADEQANKKQFNDAIANYEKLIGAYGVPENTKQAAQKNLNSIFSEYIEGKRYLESGDNYNAVHYTALSLQKGVSVAIVVKQLNDAATKLSWQADEDAKNKKLNDAVMKYRKLFNTYGVPSELQNPAIENEKKIMLEYRNAQFYFAEKSYYNAVHYASLSIAKGVTLEEVTTFMSKAASELSKTADTNANAGNKELAIDQYKKLIGAYGVPDNIKQAAQSNLNNLTK